LSEPLDAAHAQSTRVPPVAAPHRRIGPEPNSRRSPARLPTQEPDLTQRR
jgi:hypothetical protein